MADPTPPASPTPSPQAAPADRAKAAKQSRHRLRGGAAKMAYAFLFLILALVTALFIGTDGAFLPAHWAAFYVMVALLTGLAFWLFTGSSGEFSWGEFGAKMTGGAAIGIIFMFAAHKLTPVLPPNLRVIEVILPGQAEPGFILFDGGTSRVTRIPNEQRYIVEFREDALAGNVHFRYLGKNGERLTRSYRVLRVGALPDPVDTLEE